MLPDWEDKEDLAGFAAIAEGKGVLKDTKKVQLDP